MSPLIVGSGSSGSEGRSDRFGLPTGTSDPGTAEAGDLYYKTDTNKIRYYDGSAWADLASGGGGGGAAAYTIDNSLILSSSNDNYLYRVPSSGGNRQTWTWAGWVKRTLVGVEFPLWHTPGTSDDSRYFRIYFQTTDQLTITTFNSSGGTAIGLRTAQVFRDPGAWMHVVVAMDATQGLTSDRLKMYVNGSRVVNFDLENYPTQNTNYGINEVNREHSIGKRTDGNSYAHGCLSEIYFIDGSALAPTAFGAYDTTTGIWNPIAYAGTYPGNSFYLDFSNSADIGGDVSGNNNDFTPTGVALDPTNNTIYSSGVTYSPSGNEPAVNAFDGNIFTRTNTPLTSDGYVNFAFSPAISYTSSVRFYAYAANGYEITNYYSLNGGAETTFVGGSAGFNDAAWITAATGSGSMSSLRVRLTRGSGQQSAPNVHAIEVDGVILTDRNFSGYVTDSPTNGTASNGGDPGGSIVGNYATFNPLAKDGGLSLVNGNLAIDNPSNTQSQTCLSTIFVNSGKWYAEFTKTVAGIEDGVGICTNEYNLASGFYSTEKLMAFRGGNITNSGFGSVIFPTFTNAGDRIGVRMDLDNQTFGIRVNGGSWTDVTITNYDSHVAGEYWTFCVHNGSSGASGDLGFTANFGQRPFVDQAPTGYTSLNTANLPTPSILDGSDYMDVKLWDGNGGTQTISGLGFSPDLVWIKLRGGFSAPLGHMLFDSVRGATESLRPDNDTIESIDTNSLTSFNTDGFSLGNHVRVNAGGAGDNYVGWTWDAGDVAAVTNTDGTTQSTVKANVDAGFSIVQATISSSSQSLGHGLGREPAMVIRKKVDGASEWYTAIKVTGLEGYLLLNSTNTFASQATGFTSTVFNAAYTGGTETWINYCFAPIDNYSAFGSWQNNGSNDGTFVPLSFRPKLILLKNTDNVERWYIMDSSRHPYNVPPADATKLSADTADSEGVQIANTATIDFLSNGFKIRTTNPNAGEISFGTRTYFYAAFAENPFSIARAR